MHLVKSSLEEIFALTKDSAVPLGLLRVIKDTFKCSMCLGIPEPPVVTTKCCKSILGCETCVNRWYSGPTALRKQCPLCKSERGYSDIMIMRGLDNFIAEVAKLNYKEDRTRTGDERNISDDASIVSD